MSPNWYKWNKWEKRKAIAYSRKPPNICKRGNRSRGSSSGIHHLDHHTGGWHRWESFPQNTNQSKGEDGDLKVGKAGRHQQEQVIGVNITGVGWVVTALPPHVMPWEEHGNVSVVFYMTPIGYGGTLDGCGLSVTLQKLRPVLFKTVKDIRDRARLTSSPRLTS